VLQTFVDYLGQTTVVEVGALVFGITYVVLAARSIIWCWPAGIVASILSLVIAARSNYRLDVIQELYYVGMGVYGWYSWTHISRKLANRPITTNSIYYNLTLIAACGALSLGIGWWFAQMGSSLPYLDAGTTIFAFATTWLVARRVLENWIYWIVIDVASIYMYIRSGAYVFSALLGFYAVVAVVGFVTWWRIYKKQQDGGG
jgi:nicotinamide mononucleotide transporter